MWRPSMEVLQELLSESPTGIPAANLPTTASPRPAFLQPNPALVQPRAETSYASDRHGRTGLSA